MKEEEKLRILELIAKNGINAKQFIVENSGTINYTEAQPTEQKQEEVPVSADIVFGALNRCKSFIWGNSAYAVAFCVCRDLFGWQDNASLFERQLQEQGIDLPVGTINTAISRNAYMRLNVSKWGASEAMERALKLRDEFKHQVALAGNLKDKT